MILKELTIKNFGKFTNETFAFTNGLNIVYGPNEAGKTTIYHAIGALLFGLEKQRGRAAKSDMYTTYQPWENKTWYEGSLRFEVGQKTFRLERNFYHNEKSVRLICETDGEELSVEHGDLEMLLGDIGAELFYNTAAVGQMKMKPQDVVYSYLKNYIAGMQEAGKNSMDVVKAIGILEAKKKMLEQQKKKQTLEINQQIAKADARLEFVEKECLACQRQLEAVKAEMAQWETQVPRTENGFLVGLFRWLKKLFCRRKLKIRERQHKEEVLKRKEKMNFLRELLGEKESLREELLLEKQACFERLHEQSKNQEIAAIDLSIRRIRELSMLRKEEVMEELLTKISAVLAQITKGRYEKLILEENKEPVLWDGSRAVNLFQLSGGCVDQVYLAVRIGLQDLFFEEDTLPLMFDDAFVYFDDQRLERLLLYLSALDRQVLIFSCHERELCLLEKQRIVHTKIRL